MKIKISVPVFIDRTHISPSNEMALHGGTTLAQLYDLLNIPDYLRCESTCFVNDTKVNDSYVLQEGDYVMFAQVMEGG